MAETVRKNLGMVTAYAYAVSKGYSGTEEEFAELMASYADVAQDAETSAQAAAQSATTAEQKATQAAGSATNAAVSATSASESATAAAGSSNSASLYAQNASASATQAAGAASSALTYAGNASASAQAAAGSANSAQASATNAAGSADDAEAAKDLVLGMNAVANTLPAGSQATASYSNGTLTLGIPRGEKGDSGASGTTDYTDLENKPQINSVTLSGNKSLSDLGVPSESDLQEKAPGIYETASGSVASFSDGADDLPLKSCVVSIEPIQEGEGDPSPENVRAISGRTGLTLLKAGGNLINDSIKTVNSSGNSLTIGGGTNDYWLYLPVGTYTLSCKFASGEHYSVLVKNQSDPQQQIWSVSSIAESASFDITRADYYRLWFYRNVSSGGVTANGVSDIMLNYGATPIPYESYQRETIAVNWQSEAGAVYGGTLDIVSGKLTVDRAYIASYDGETLPSTWISDRDVYAEGTTPTTGAQVVYMLAEPIEYQLESQEIRTLLRENNIWSAGGDISVEYPADTKTYIDAFSIKTVEVSGQTPVIVAEENTRYICGEVTSLTFTPCASGICDVRFTAASISTVLTLPQTLKLPDWFDPTALEANTTYEINIVDGIYGAVMSWA